MRGGLALVYTSLLTVSVLSSCALFILVVSEASHPVGGVQSDSLSNVSQSNTTQNNNIEFDLSEKSLKLPKEDTTDTKTPLFLDNELAFAEALSQNSVIADGLPDTGQPPILLSLADTAKLDLQDVPEKLSIFGNNSEQHNDTQVHVSNDSAQIEITGEKESTISEDRKTERETLVVQAKPMHEAKLTEEAFIPTTAKPKIEDVELLNKDNETESVNAPLKAEPPHEDMPSFSEWAQKQLAEAEKQGTVLNHSSQPSHSNTNVNNKGAKLRSKNYASPACGAKIVAVNPEAGSASSILTPNKDEYMLNTCNSRIWFVVELCEAVQAQKIEIANFELFSSSPKDFAVYFSDRFPTREWTSVGQFTAKYDRDVQSFDLFPHLFGKFIKVEMLSHYGSEHYCPISLFKVYGTSEFEVLEKENSQHANEHLEDDDDEILGDLPDVPITDTEISKNLFGSARDAVMSIMKKAAQALVKSESPKNNSAQLSENKTSETYKKCCTPSHIIVCDNCSDVLFNEVYDLISCSSNKLMNLINKIFIHETLRNTDICQKYGLDFKNKRTISFRNERAHYLSVVFSENYIAALCNFLAIIDKKVVMNTSYETELNVTSNLTLDKVSNTVVDDNNFQDIVQIPFKDKIPNENDAIEAKNDVPIVPDSLTMVQEKQEITQKELDRGPEKITEPTKEVFPNIEEIIESKSTDKTIEAELNQTKESIETPTEKSHEIVDKSAEKPKLEQPEDNNIKPDLTNVKAETPLIENDKIQPIPLIEEINDQLVIDAEGFMSDLDQIIADPGLQTTASPNVPSQGQPLQKESVFLRLSNRVKTLERNMSLSAQYLEELSRRYKKQVEEMQKSFEKTILQMTEERKKTEGRDQQNLEQLTNLQEQLAKLNTVMFVLMEERDSWFGNITFFKFVFFQTIIILVIFYYVNRKPVTVPSPVFNNRKSSRSKNRDKNKLRRKSVEGVSGHKTPASKKRRPSEEALDIARQSAEDVGLDLDDGDWQIARKNRKRKTSIIHRMPTVFNPALNTDFMRQDSIGILQDNVISLDEEEFIAPVSEPKEFNETNETAKHPPKKEFPKTNGSILNNLKGATQPVKSRRLSSPAFFRTALSRQSSRSTPSPVVQRVNETVVNGKPVKKGKKGISESPSGSLWSNSSELPTQENGQCDSESNSVKQTKRKSLRSIFKKVFE